MKQTFALIAIASLLSVVLFGFLLMTGDLHEMTTCIVAALQGTECLGAQGSLSFAAFHLEALKLFSTAIFSVLLLSFVAALAGVFLLYSFSSNTLLFWGVSKRELVFDKPLFQPARKFVRWLSLNLHSPTSF